MSRLMHADLPVPRADPRCAICGCRDRHDPRGAWHECTHCGLRYRDGHRSVAHIGADLADRLARPHVDLVADPPDDWTCELPTLRIAGYRFGRTVRPGALPGQATTAALAAHGPAITLAMLGRPADLPAIATTVDRLAARFAAVRVLIDNDDAALVAGLSRSHITYLVHPLDDDFAAQRNRLQASCETPWQFQLDADEALDDALLAAMPGLAADGDALDLHAFAFPRRNIVDDAWSDHWPDVQYRLNRAHVRFAGVVHERPIPSRDWRHSALAPVGAILHRLDGDRVRARTARYAAMTPGGARPADEAALLRRFNHD